MQLDNIERRIESSSAEDIFSVKVEMAKFSTFQAGPRVFRSTLTAA